jgi:hypothetical protein
MTECVVNYKELEPGMILADPPPAVKEISGPLVVSGVNRDFEKDFPPTNGQVYVFNEKGEYTQINTTGVDGTFKVRKDPAFLSTFKDVPAMEFRVGGSTYAGADPEVFATRGDGTVIPAWEFLPAKPTTPKGFGVEYWDGFQAEFTIEPTHCHAYATDRVRRGLQRVWRAARQVHPDAVLSIESAVRVPREVLMAANPNHVSLGCAPSQNVYGESRMAVPDTYELEWRFAGAHIHHGTNSIHEGNLARTIRTLDAMAGVVNVAMGGKFVNRERRRWYGRAGEFRWHPYTTPTTQYAAGTISTVSRLEYRVPDTLILAHPATYNFYMDFERMALKMGMGGWDFLWHADEDEVRTIINQGDVELARQVVGRNERMFHRVVGRCYGMSDDANAPVVRVALQLVMEGMESILRDPTDIVGNWMLEAEEDKGYTPQPDPPDTPHTHDLTKWRPEGYRSHTTWPTGKWWGSAVQLVDGGRKV